MKRTKKLNFKVLACFLAFSIAFGSVYNTYANVYEYVEESTYIEYSDSSDDDAATWDDVDDGDINEAYVDDACKDDEYIAYECEDEDYVAYECNDDEYIDYKCSDDNYADYKCNDDEHIDYECTDDEYVDYECIDDEYVFSYEINTFGDALEGVLYSYDLSLFVTNINISLYPGGGTAAGDIEHGQEVRFAITFNENEILQMQHNSDGYLIYQLPSVLVWHPINNEAIFNANNQEVGRLWLDTNGLLRVQFHQINHNGSYMYFFDIATNTQFELGVRARVDYIPGGSIEFDIITITVRPPIARLRIMQNSRWLVANSFIEYTAAISSDGTDAANGVHLNVALDFAGGFGNFGGVANMPLRNPQNNTAIEVTSVQANDIPVSNFTVTYQLISMNGLDNVLEYFTVHFPGNNMLEPDDHIIVEYRVHLHTLIDNNLHLTTPVYFHPASGTYEFLITLRSMATAVGSNTNPIEAHAASRAERRLPESGKGRDPGSAHVDLLRQHTTDTNWRMRWGARVGNGRYPMNGDMLIDVLQPVAGNHSAIYFRDANLPAVGGLTSQPMRIRLYGMPTIVNQGGSGATVRQNIDFAISGSNLDRIAELNMTNTAVRNALAPYFSLSDCRTSFTFVIPPTDFIIPSGTAVRAGQPLGEVYRVIFLFDTLHENPTANVRFFNHIYHYRNNALVERVRGYMQHDVMGVMSVRRHAEIGNQLWQNPETGEWYARLVTRLAVPGSEYQGPVVLVDRLFVRTNDSDVGLNNTANTIAFYNPIPQQRSVTLYPGGEPVTHTIIPGSAPHEWVMVFGTDNATDRNESRWPFNTDQTIYVTHYVPLSLTPVGSVSPLSLSSIAPASNVTTIESLLRQSPNNIIQPQVQAGNSNGSVLDDAVIGGHFHGLDWPIHSNVSVDLIDDMLFHHTVQLNARVNHRTNPLFFDEQGNFAGLFAETLHPGMELLPGTFYVEVLGGVADSGMVHRFFGPYQPTAQSGGALVHSNALTLLPNGFNVDLNALNIMDMSSQNIIVGNLLEIFQQTGSSQHVSPRLVIRYQTRVVDPTAISESIIFSHPSITSPARGTFMNTEPHTFHLPGYPLQKDMIPVGTTNRINVQIVINQSGAELAPGSNINQFTAMDTMSPNLSLVPDSFIIEVQDWDNVNERWNGIWRRQPVSTTYGLWYMSVNSAQNFSVIVPNRAPIRFSYDVMVDAIANTPNDINNTIELVGFYEWESSIEGFTYTMHALVSSTPTAIIELIKESTNSQNPLQGAEFSLYATHLPYHGTFSGANFNRRRTIDEIDFYYINASGITNADGVITFTSTALVWNFAYIFMLVETAAPQGYLLPDRPYTFFTLNGANVTDEQRKYFSDLFDAEIHRGIINTLIVTNEPEPTTLPPTTEPATTTSPTTEPATTTSPTTESVTTTSPTTVPTTTQPTTTTAPPLESTTTPPPPTTANPSSSSTTPPVTTANPLSSSTTPPITKSNPSSSDTTPPVTTANPSSSSTTPPVTTANPSSSSTTPPATTSNPTPSSTSPDVTTPETTTPANVHEPEPETAIVTIPVVTIPPISTGTNNELIPSEDDSYWIEINDVGIVLGTWHWNNETTTWVFHAEAPSVDAPHNGVNVGAIPQTGHTDINLYLIWGFYLAISSALLAIGLFLHKKSKR
ncbi:MAG: SpaA isopeptide-forming pilin-related protein [Defluviitaleaceae bacterium]|nr:SpaA isopeptide-forming pilin-related protein [Defluviitaleaceae bacterium]